MLHAGETFEGRFRIDAVLGEGGFSTVYRAYDTHVRRDVALKVLRPVDPNLEARFWREVRAIAGLRDPHTVQLFDYGTSADGRLYAVFELLEGRDLRAILKDRVRLEPAEVVSIGRQVLASLREAHSSGLIHRDIKPENIRVVGALGADRSVRLLDFGLARREDPQAPQITAAGELIGTPRYMSPEQLLHEPLSAASDIYSLGVVLVELLCGDGSLQGGRLGDQIERLRTGYLFAVTSAQSGALTAVIARMTARRPEDRYPSAQAALHALESVELHAPRPTLPPAPVPAESFAMPSPKATTGRMLSIGVGAALAVGLTYAALRDSAPARADAKAEGAGGTRSVAGLVKSEGGPDAAPVPQARVNRATGCTQTGVTPGPMPASTMIGVTPMRWTRYVPRNYQSGKPHPLLILLPPRQKPGGMFLSESGFLAMSDRANFVVLAPTPLTDNGWDSVADNSALRKVVTDLADSVCIDAQRIYVVGHISGGHGATRLACEPWIAAGVSSSSRPGTTDFACPSNRSVPFLVYSPMKTDHARPEGGRNCAGSMKIPLADHERMWRERNGCTGDARERLRLGDSVCWEWDCAAAPFVSCHLDGGHPWPGEPPRHLDQLIRKCDGTPADFPSAQVAWDFVKSHRAAVGPRDY